MTYVLPWRAAAGVAGVLLLFWLTRRAEPRRPWEEKELQEAQKESYESEEEEKEEKELEKERAVPRLFHIEVLLMILLFLLLVRAAALVGQTSEEQAKSGILPGEQVVWNFQKLLRCILIVLCCSCAYLEDVDLSQDWPNLVFQRFRQELWLLGEDSEDVAQRRRWMLLLVILSRALLGTVRSFMKFQGSIDEYEESERNICSGFFINLIIFLLDVTANCGFLLGFSAGRHYFAPSDGEESTTVRYLCRPKALIHTETEENKVNKEEVTSRRPSSLGLSKELSRSNWQGWSLEHHGPIFLSYARRAMLGLLVTSALECYFLSHWEVGILGNREDEVDVFRIKPYFQSWTPDFSRWRLRRVILGSWRDLFYFVLLHPWISTTFASLFFSTTLLTAHGFSRFQKLQRLLQKAFIAALSYLVLLSAQRAYFAMSCLLICWECRSLEIRFTNFAKLFPQLSPRERYLQHFALLDEVKELQRKTAPMIRYVFLQRFAYLALDVARQSCDALLPFNLVHYLFRHVMFLTALAITAWRIGKLNFSVYEKLHNRVMDLLPRNWAEHLGRSASLQQEVTMQRQHAEDWFRYLQHNIDTGRRDACISVFQLRFAAKSHVVSLSFLTLLTLPLLNKVLEFYGRHVVNERLWTPSFLNRMESTCAAEA